jgi:phosphoenolpyruvate---glycerone phosphotransferase subunit DhaL
MNATQLNSALIYVTRTIEANKDYLCMLDSEVGDGDHGVSMTIGMRAARKALSALKAATPEAAFSAIAGAFADEVGASSGIMYELGFAAAAQSIRGVGEITTADEWARIFTAIADAIQKVGKAEVGDKTMLDAWMPAASAAREAARTGREPVAALLAATNAAQAGVESTKNLLPKFGRASFLGERARGHQDAGATSALLIIKALHDYAATESKKPQTK